MYQPDNLYFFFFNKNIKGGIIGRDQTNFLADEDLTSFNFLNCWLSEFNIL